MANGPRKIYKATNICRGISKELRGIYGPNIMPDKRVNRITGYQDIDQAFCGLPEGNLVIIGARPAMGKTCLAVDIVRNNFLFTKQKVLYFSLAESAENIITRLISSISAVPFRRMTDRELCEGELLRVKLAIEKIQENYLYIDDEPGLSIDNICESARLISRENDLFPPLIIIDYLQLISTSNTDQSLENKRMEIAEITKKLKFLAKELSATIICLSQLTRKVEDRPGHRPIITDLPESSSIEQDADIVMFLLRRDYYDKYDVQGQAEIIIAKNRTGKEGCVKLTFDREVPCFADFCLPIVQFPEPVKAYVDEIAKDLS